MPALSRFKRALKRALVIALLLFLLLAEFPAVYARETAPSLQYGLMYGHLSTAPHSYLDEMLLYVYRLESARGAVIPPLSEVRSVKLRRLVFNLAKQGTLPMRLKWLAEKYVEPRLESCPVSHNQALGEAEACDILHEYFVPRDRFVEFVDGMRRVLRARRANLLNASVRVVHPEDNVATGLGGTFFLPYQLHYTAEQLRRAYPAIREFFAAKRQYDPSDLLSSTFSAKYAPLVGG